MLKRMGKNAAFVPWVVLIIQLVLVAGFDQKEKSKGGIPGIRFKVVGVKGISLLALFPENKKRNDKRYLHFF